ncbi:MAG TPA: 16S rRNA (guanine(527)-N(7))-methyltransferase RsmG [Acidobacteriota bacterium]|nr:16S rRNA (guanine(527)-N(7))-methyltransferase RsmG [Acidobacteriota bacterium]
MLLNRRTLQSAIRNPKSAFEMVTADWIETEARFFHLTLTKDEIEQVLAYLEVLKKWNKKVNLTGIRSDEEAVRLHFLESFFAAEHLPGAKIRVVDVGSGAGFPGLAMKIVRPEMRMVLLDSRKKKVLFQKEVARHLEMRHVVSYALRLQEAAPFLQQADVVCWRALKIEGRDFQFLKDNTLRNCRYLCFQGAGERTERSLEGCEIEKIPIPQSENRTLLVARKILQV